MVSAAMCQIFIVKQKDKVIACLNILYTISTALGATLVCRVVTLWFAVLLGGLAWLTVHLTERP